MQKGFDNLALFQTCSGLKLNKSKTKIFYLGNTNHKPSFNDIEITNNFKALGIYFSKDIEKITEINLDERYKKFKNILNMWRQRDLSLKGKITILKSLAIPQLTYVTNVLYVPDKFIAIKYKQKYNCSFGTETTQNKKLNYDWRHFPRRTENATF